MSGWVKNNFPSFYIWMGILVLAVLEYFIWYPHRWFVLGIGVVVISLCLRMQLRNVKIVNAYIALNLILIPGFLALFFIDLAVWQHVFAVVCAVLIASFFKYINTISTTQEYDSVKLAFPLANIFFMSMVALGVQTFFRTNSAYNAIVFAIMIVFFPLTLRLIPRSKISTIKEREVCFWPRDNSGKNFLFKTFLLSTNSFFTKRKVLISNMSVLLTLSAVQLFLIIASLPINIIVGSGVITIVLYGMWSLITYTQIKALNRDLVIRYIGISLIFVSILLISAQWS